MNGKSYEEDFFFLLSRDHENMTVSSLGEFCFYSKTFHFYATKWDNYLCHRAADLSLYLLSNTQERTVRYRFLGKGGVEGAEKARLDFMEEVGIELRVGGPRAMREKEEVEGVSVCIYICSGKKQRD